VSDPVWGIVVAAGAGRRFGGEKQFELLGGRPVHEWAVTGLRSVAAGVVLVVPPGSAAPDPLGLADRVVAGGTASPDPLGLADRVVAGGQTRAESVRAGLRAVPADAAIVVVHDAARPLASEDLFRAVVAAVVGGADGAIPGISVVDTIKRVDGNVVVDTLDRSDLVGVQTPQAFRASMLRRGHAGRPEVTDDAGVIEALGGVVVVVPGEDANLKITSPADLAFLEWRLRSMSAL
jgi:2-C-methyl-D-erythritol 4-phosphate cytidylyltransferase